MNLVNVYFTTTILSGSQVLEKPHVLTALPYSTAQTYKRFGNWRIEPYVLSNDERKPRRFERAERGMTRGEIRVTAAASSPGKSSIHHAAATGDLAAAINAGAK